MKAFWNCQVREVSAMEVKNAHKNDRGADRQNRFQNKMSLRSDGATSNLYPITCNVDASVYRYELEVIRKSAGDAVGRVAPISSTKAWRSVANGLRRFPAMPPIVRVDNRIYAASQLPAEMLDLPKEFHDLGWQSCRMQPVDKINFLKLPPSEYRSLVNKIFPWAVSVNAQRDGNFSVVRDLDGKIVCTHDGLTVSGLRIFRGTTAQALFIDNSDGVSIKPQQELPPPPSSVLATLQVGAIDTPLIVRCVRHERDFVFKGLNISVFTVKDASRSIDLTLWEAPPLTLQPGKLYSLANIKFKVTPQSGKSLLEATFKTAIIRELPEDASDVKEVTDVESAQQLSLKLDTKCLVASERSLWEEVKQHFGPGPWDEDTQRRIARVVQGTPIVVSTNLRHATVRVLRFNVTPETAPLDAGLKSVIPLMDRGQPFAVLHDYSVVPLQALHCSYDPRMKTWQDITVASCSFLPARRVSVLSEFRTALELGLAQWGLSLAREPFVSKNLALLDAPTKANYRPQGQQSTVAVAPVGPNFPTTVMVCSIANDRTSPEDREKNTTTAQAMAKNFKTPYIAHASSEQEATQLIDQSLLANGVLKDVNSAIIIISSDRQTRANRWLVAECLRRGILPVCIPGLASQKRVALLCENTRVNLRNKFERNPVKGIDIGKDIPVLASKRVLVIGVDCCNTANITIGSVVGVIISPAGNVLIPTFWRNEVRGQEVEQVAEHFGYVVQKALQYQQIDEVIVLQDGNVFSELQSMKRRVPLGIGLTFMCLHKRTNIRFMQKGAQHTTNITKGSVIQSLTPSPINFKPLFPSFYLQSHDCFMSTARTVQYTVHSLSSAVDVADVQKLSFHLSHVFSPLATKLPISTRCAHKLSAVAERLIDASPDFTASLIPDSLMERMWFL